MHTLCKPSAPCRGDEMRDCNGAGSTEVQSRRSNVLFKNSIHIDRLGAKVKRIFTGKLLESDGGERERGIHRKKDNSSKQQA